MNPRPLDLQPTQRALLREFEQLHEEWLRASAAADAVECRAAMERQEVQRVLHYRLVADEVHQKAMRLLRDAPI